VRARWSGILLSMATDFPFSHRLSVRFRDCDPRGHVNNAVYFTYFEECRLALWRHLTGADGMPGFGTILARAECDFRAPAFVNDQLDVRVKVGELGRSSITLVYDIVNVKTGQCLANSKAVLVSFVYKAQRPMPIPEEVRGLLAKMGSDRGQTPV
jgi:acyl-CoA thioester hydrolase